MVSMSLHVVYEATVQYWLSSLDRRTYVYKLSGANGDRGNSVFPVQLTTNRIGNHNTRLMPSLLKVMTTHTPTLLRCLIATTD